jgi:hypothetical protein
MVPERVDEEVLQVEKKWTLNHIVRRVNYVYRIEVQRRLVRVTTLGWDFFSKEILEERERKLPSLLLQHLDLIKYTALIKIILKPV